MSQSATQAQPGVGIIGPVRLSYMNVFAPKLNKFRDEEEYSVTILIPKMPTEHCANPKAVGKAVTDLINAAIEKKFGTKPPKFDTPLKDGDVETNGEGEPKHPGYWFLSARCGTDYPPMLIDGHRNIVSGGWQSGDWGMVKVSLYGYEYQHKKGVGCGLRAVQFLYHDEPFGGGGARPDEFDAVADAHQGVTGIENAGAEGGDGAPYDPFADE